MNDDRSVPYGGFASPLARAFAEFGRASGSIFHDSLAEQRPSDLPPPPRLRLGSYGGALTTIAEHPQPRLNFAVPAPWSHRLSSSLSLPLEAKARSVTHGNSSRSNPKDDMNGYSSSFAGCPDEDAPCLTGMVITTVNLNHIPCGKNDHDDGHLGRCIHQPGDQLCKRNRFGDGCKTLMNTCSDCCVEKLRRTRSKRKKGKEVYPEVTISFAQKHGRAHADRSLRDSFTTCSDITLSSTISSLSTISSRDDASERLARVRRAIRVLERDDHSSSSRQHAAPRSIVIRNRGAEDRIARVLHAVQFLEQDDNRGGSRQHGTSRGGRLENRATRDDLKQGKRVDKNLQNHDPQLPAARSTCMRSHGTPSASPSSEKNSRNQMQMQRNGIDGNHSGYTGTVHQDFAAHGHGAVLNVSGLRVEDTWKNG